MLNRSAALEEQGKTAMLIALQGRACGVLGIADQSEGLGCPCRL